MSTTPTTSPPPATLAEILADTNTDLEYTIGVKDLPSMPLQVPPKSIEPSCNTHTPVLDVKEAPVLAESTPKVLTAAEQQRKKEMEALDAQTLKHEQDMKAKKAKEDAERDAFIKMFDAAQPGGKAMSYKDPYYAPMLKQLAEELAANDSKDKQKWERENAPSKWKLFQRKWMPWKKLEVVQKGDTFKWAWA